MMNRLCMFVIFSEKGGLIPSSKFNFPSNFTVPFLLTRSVWKVLSTSEFVPKSQISVPKFDMTTCAGYDKLMK